MATVRKKVGNGNGNENGEKKPTQLIQILINQVRTNSELKELGMRPRFPGAEEKLRKAREKEKEKE